MAENKLIDKIRELYLRKSSNFSTEEGRVHPIHEALAALLKEQVSDEDAEKEIEKGDGEGIDEIKRIKKVIIVDGLLEILSITQQRSDIKNMLKSRRPLNEILEKAALYIAEGKRTQDGQVIQPVSKSAYNLQKDILRALKKEIAGNVYINTNRVQNLEEQARKIKKRRTAKILTSIVLSATLCIGGYFARQRINEVRSYITNSGQIKAQIQTEIQDLERIKEDKTTNLESLTTELAYKEKLLSETEDKIKTATLNYNYKQREASILERKLAELDGRYKEKSNELANLGYSITKKGKELADITTSTKTAKQELEKELASTKTDLEKTEDEIKGFSNEYYQLGKECYDKEKYGDARRLLKKSVELDENNKEAKDLLEKTYGKPW